MSDDRRGLPHDLPTPKVTVFRAVNGRWYWGHRCSPNCWISGPTIARNEIEPPLMGCTTWAEAYRYGDKHARSCL